MNGATVRPTLGSTTAGAQVAIDLDQLIETRLLLQGASGSGKSWSARRLLEQTHGLVQHLVLDTEGEYASLRERFDYVLAGPDGDCRAEAHHAGLLARRLLEFGISAIVDLHEMRSIDRPRFVRGFYEALVDAPRSLWHDALVVIEECHLVAPQGGREAESTEAVIDLATRGRKRGFALVAVTQRISDLHKSVVAQCGNRLIGLTTLDADVKRAAYELGFEGRDRAHQLAKLARGQFFAFGPAISASVIPVSVGPVATTHAHRHGSRAAPPPPPPEKVRAILEKLVDFPSEAEEEGRTVEALTRKLCAAERELRAARADATDPAAVERARAEGVVEGERRALDQISAVERRFTCAADRVERARLAIVAAAEALGEALPAPPKDVAAAADAKHLATPRLPAALSQPVPVLQALSSGNGHLSRPQYALLDALAWLKAAARIERPRRAQVALVAEVSSTSSGFEKNLSVLSSAGLIRYPSPGTVELTEDGSGIAHPPPELKQAELHDSLCRRVSRPQAQVLRAVIEAYPRALTRGEVAEKVRVSEKSSGFEKNVSTLSSLGLVEYPERGSVRAAAVLFLEQ